jgi:hypothetical protein
MLFFSLFVFCYGLQFELTKEKYENALIFVAWEHHELERVVRQHANDPAVHWARVPSQNTPRPQVHWTRGFGLACSRVGIGET